ncbi:MAG TPA: hypothetical protein VM012_12200 [Flavitalea sp.]|nr:hypothetical protein [Flavitalea sp.]
MPESRKRAGHHDYKKPADIPAKQRTKGRILWAILLAVFATIFAYFAVGDNYKLLALIAVLGALVGYFIGRGMEKDVTHTHD